MNSTLPTETRPYNVGSVEFTDSVGAFWPMCTVHHSSTREGGDLWVQWWRNRFAGGDVTAVRFADDFAMGFEYQDDALRFLADLRERFAKCGLEWHPDKTRLIEFGQHAARHRKARGDRKPETFDILGFTHRCGLTTKGRFWVKRKTISKRMRAKLAEVNEELKRRRSQRTRLTWTRMNRIATRWLPPARLRHPFPDTRFDARTQGRSPVR